MGVRAREEEEAAASEWAQPSGTGHRERRGGHASLAYSWAEKEEGREKQNKTFPIFQMVFELDFE